MTLIHIKKIQTTGANGSAQEAYAVPCVAIATPQGRKLIPNPAGGEAQVFSSLNDAEDAIKRAGFDYIFEGKMTYTMGQGKPLGNIALNNAGRPLEQAVQSLIHHLRDREPSVVANAAFALGALRAQASLEALSDILGHDDPNVRKNVAEALARLGLPAVHALRDAFLKARTSPHTNAPYIRLTVMTAYLELIEQGLNSASMEQFLPLVVESLEDESWLVRAQAAMVIAQAALALEAEKNAAEARKNTPSSRH